MLQRAQKSRIALFPGKKTPAACCRGHKNPWNPGVHGWHIADWQLANRQLANWQLAKWQVASWQDNVHIAPNQGNTQKEALRFPNACDERLPIRTLGEGATTGASGTMVPPERRWTPAMHELQGYKVGCSGYEFGCYSTFWHFEKGILHEIARSSD